MRAPVVYLASLCAFFGCRAVPKPPPLIPIAVETGVELFSGDAIGGPLGTTVIPGSEVLRVACSVFWAERMPWEALEPLSAATRLVLEGRAATPLMPAADLAPGARLGTGAEALALLESEHAGRLLVLLEEEVALDEGRGVRFFARSPERLLASDGARVERLVAILVSRMESVAEASVALELEDLASEEERRVPRRQVVLLEERCVPGVPVILVFPSPYPGPYAPEALIAKIEIQRLDPDDPAQAALLERSRARASAQAAPATVPVDPGLARGLEALNTPRLRRAALVFLAGEAAASLALDLALVADEDLLEAWSERILGQGDAPEWRLERSAYGILARGLDRDALSPALRGLLARHAGEAGRFPGTLTGLLERARSREAFERQVVEENLAFLELEEPASRVRAYDWLSARDLAPAEFDPLGAREQRTAALERFFASREQER